LVNIFSGTNSDDGNNQVSIVDLVNNPVITLPDPIVSFVFSFERFYAGGIGSIAKASIAFFTASYAVLGRISNSLLAVFLKTI